jgi:frataxin
LGSRGTFGIIFNLIKVLNKQPPNLQIWFSSPISGPKRYDWLEGEWRYKKDDLNLQQVFYNAFILKCLSKELSSLLEQDVKIDIKYPSHLA